MPKGIFTRRIGGKVQSYSLKRLDAANKKIGVSRRNVKGMSGTTTAKHKGSTKRGF